MIYQIDLYGVFLPSMMVMAVVSFLITMVVRKGLARIHFYRLVWHRPLFDFALYACILGLIVLIAPRLLS